MTVVDDDGELNPHQVIQLNKLNNYYCPIIFINLILRAIQIWTQINTPHLRWQVGNAIIHWFVHLVDVYNLLLLLL